MSYARFGKRKKREREPVGCHDGQPISQQYQLKINANQKRLIERQTPAERAFGVIVEELEETLQMRVKRQYVFYITEGIAFIADFFFSLFHVAIEIDGGGHYRTKERERDKWRDSVLKQKARVRVIRFSNNEVLGAPELVKEKLIEALLAAENVAPLYQRRLYNQIHRRQRISDFEYALLKDG